MADVVAGDDPRTTGRVIATLRRGGVVVMPTDTVYGLAARASDPAATAALFRCKGRGTDIPIAVLCSSTAQAFGLAAPPVPDHADRLAARHWPGGLTLVLPRRTDLDWALGEPHDTIGVRCPDHDLVRAVAEAVGPIATTSANRHGEPTPASAPEAVASLVGAVDLVVDGGTLTGAPSTVVDATTPTLRVLRQGALDVGLG